MNLRIDRKWAMPNRCTFSIKPILQLLKEEVLERRTFEELWIDPFSGGSYIADITNDLNPSISATYHKEALDFLKMYDDDSIAGVLYDPPYSPRQVAECYKGLGIGVTQQMTQSSWWSQTKDEIARVVKPGGKVISFGWNSNGMGKKRGFQLVRILLVAHGGMHHDTICLVELKREDIRA